MRWPRELKPTVDERSALTADGLLDELLASLGGVVVPVARTSRTIGLDGVAYSVRVQDGLIAAELTWWEGHPPEWRALMTWFGEAWRRIATELGDHEAMTTTLAWESSDGE